MELLKSDDTRRHPALSALGSGFSEGDEEG